jgi:hypothetical protein
MTTHLLAESPTQSHVLQTGFLVQASSPITPKASPPTGFTISFVLDQHPKIIKF